MHQLSVELPPQKQQKVDTQVGILPCPPGLCARSSGGDPRATVRAHPPYPAATSHGVRPVRLPAKQSGAPLGSGREWALVL